MEPVKLATALVFFVLTTSIATVLFYRRKKSGINALDWPIGVFTTTALMGLFQTIKVLNPELPIYAPDGGAIGTDIVRLLHLFALILLFIMSEVFISERINTVRTVVFFSLISMFGLVTIYFFSTGTVLKTTEVLGFGNPVSNMDEAIFDVLQFFTVTELTYVYVAQYNITKFDVFKKYLTFFVIALAIFWVGSTLEVLEHFVPGVPNFDAFLLGIPTFLILAYSYISFPEFVYLAPSDITFLQIIDKYGVVYYAAELKDEDLNASDFLLGPGITTVNTMLEDFIGESDVEIKKFVFNKRVILFEKIGDIRMILLTNKPVNILKRAMRYFLREFTKEFDDQIKDFKGYLTPSPSGKTPDDLFKQCLPIVQNRNFSSNYRAQDSAN